MAFTRTVRRVFDSLNTTSLLCLIIFIARIVLSTHLICAIVPRPEPKIALAIRAGRCSIPSLCLIASVSPPKISLLAIIDRRPRQGQSVPHPSSCPSSFDLVRSVTVILVFIVMSFGPRCRSSPGLDAWSIPFSGPKQGCRERGSRSCGLIALFGHLLGHTS